MTGGREDERKKNEEKQFELADRFLSSHGGRVDWTKDLNDGDRRLLFEELKSHQSLHVAQGNEPEAALLMDGLELVASGNEHLLYKFRRLEISENERRGLGGRALTAMGVLYETFRNSRRFRARSAEVVMEFGILQDRYGDKEEAYKFFKHSIGRYERSGHRYNLSAAWFNAASVLYDLGRIRASLNACEKGLSLGGASHLDLKTHILLQRANCRERTGEIDLAIEDYIAASTGYSKLGRRRQECNILFRVGWLYGRQRQNLEARNHLHRALKISRELDYSAGLARFHLKRAQYLAGNKFPKRVQQHLQHAIMYAKLARLDKIEKVARGGIFRSQIGRRRPLTFFMKARAPEANAEALAKASQGSYSHRLGDGAATRVWRDSPRSAGKDITFLARLLAELGRQADRPDLVRQSKAVTAWQRSVRQGKRIL